MILDLIEHTHFNVCLYSSLFLIDNRLNVFVSDWIILFGLLRSIVISFHFDEQVFHCAQQVFKEIVQHQCIQWNNHYNQTSGSKVSGLAQSNCCSHRIKWVPISRGLCLRDSLHSLQLSVQDHFSWSFLIIDTAVCFIREHFKGTLCELDGSKNNVIALRPFVPS